MIISPEEVPGNLDQRSALFDLEKCSLPLRIRTREPGDIFFPKGFGKTKKVKRFYIDEKVPFPVRDHVPILVNCKNEILWVCGYRMDNRFTVDERTSRTLLVRINKRNGE